MQIIAQNSSKYSEIFAFFTKKSYLCAENHKFARLCRSTKIINLKFKTSILLLFLGFALLSCSRPSQPLPYGYFRIDIPDYGYQSTDLPGYPYSFEYADIARIDTRVDNAAAVAKTGEGEDYWLDVVYPTLNARIHCSYKPINSQLSTVNSQLSTTSTLAHLTDESIRMVFDHAIRADAIPEQGFSNPDEHVYGVYYDLEGNTASPVQFFLTDSTRHFFRAALYYNNIPNADSLAPVNDVLRRDIHHLIESFRWQ